MELKDYAQKILTDHGCDRYTYGGEQSKHLLDDLKAEYPDGMEYGFGYVEVANAILEISRPEPIKRSEYMVMWDTDSCSDGYGCDSLEMAQDSAIETLINWMMEEQSAWKNPDAPTAEEKENWNYMIYNCGVSVAKYNKITDDYDTVWEPSDFDVDRIGWLLWEEEY